LQGGSEEFELVKDVVTGIRSMRAENKIEPVKKLNAIISAGDKADLFKENTAIIKGLARLSELVIEPSVKKPDGAVGFVVSNVEVFIDLADAVDLGKETERLSKEIVELKKYLASLEIKLNNPEFKQNAPVAVVEKEQQKLTEAKEKLIKLNNQLEGLNK